MKSEKAKVFFKHFEERLRKEYPTDSRVDDMIKGLSKVVEEAEDEIIDRSVEAFNRACALMQNCRHCNGDCFCEDNFRSLIANPEIVS